MTNYYDLLKVSKMSSLRLIDLNNYLDVCLCKFKISIIQMLCIGLWLAKINIVVLNKAIHDTFYCLKEVKINSKDPWHFLSPKKVKKGDVEKKCPGSLY